MNAKLLFLGLVCLLGFTACEKEHPEAEPTPTPLPELPDPDDVCSCMDDPIFAEYCLENFDTNRDRKVSRTEANTVRNIYCHNMEIHSLKGIGYFTNLHKLDCQQNQLGQLDVSNNSELTHLNCSFNNLTVLEVRLNLILFQLCCNHNSLTYLDVSRNMQLSALDCTENNIGTLALTFGQEIQYLNKDDTTHILYK